MLTTTKSHQIQMATKTRFPGYSVKKRYNISEINISLNTLFSVLGFEMVHLLLCLLYDF